MAWQLVVASGQHDISLWILFYFERVSHNHMDVSEIQNSTLYLLKEKFIMRACFIAARRCSGQEVEYKLRP